MFHSMTTMPSDGELPVQLWLLRTHNKQTKTTHTHTERDLKSYTLEFEKNSGIKCHNISFNK